MIPKRQKRCDDEHEERNSEVARRRIRQTMNGQEHAVQHQVGKTVGHADALGACR